MYQATQQYNAFGPQMQQYGRDRAAFGQQYNKYTSDVNAYNNQAQNYRNTYGSGYENYSNPGSITPMPLNSLLGQPERASSYNPEKFVNAYVTQQAENTLGGKGVR